MPYTTPYSREFVSLRQAYPALFDRPAPAVDATPAARPDPADVTMRPGDAVGATLDRKA